MEEKIRMEGAVPATIGLLNGRIVIGLSQDQLTQMAITPNIQKVSRRDLGITLATKKMGATTVAGTTLCAHMAGIRFFATGGIGGVHRGAQTSFDISADLIELSRTPILVACSGAKYILDLNLTLEYMETQGIPVIGWQTDEFPAFYVRNSGYRLPYRADDPATIARIARTQWACNLSGIVVGCPVPEHYAMEPAPLEAAIEEALKLAKERGIRGAATTPFVLAYIAQITSGESVESNKALLLNNATWAARFARAYYNNK